MLGVCVERCSKRLSHSCLVAVLRWQARSCVCKPYANFSCPLSPASAKATPCLAIYQLLSWEQAGRPSWPPQLITMVKVLRGDIRKHPLGVPGVWGTMQAGWLMHLVSTLSGFKSFSLTSVELQMLTNSCVKLQTVHSIPLTINKEGGLSSQGLLSLSAVSTVFETIGFSKECVCY